VADQQSDAEQRILAVVGDDFHGVPFTEPIHMACKRF
jgi:hypothetical protein